MGANRGRTPFLPRPHSSLIGVAALVATLAAAPAAAQDLAPPEGSAPTELAGGDAQPIAESPSIQDAIANAEASHAAWFAARDTALAQETRQHSRSANRGLSDAEALEAIRATYPRLLSEPLWSPPPLEGGDEIVGWKTDNAAQIAGPDREEGTIHSATPIRSSLGTGEPGLVNIGLSQGPGGTYEPANPLVRYSLPGRLAEGVRFEDGPLGVRFPDARDVTTQRADEKLVALNAWADSDLVLSPLPEGFATTQVLRSPASPESFRVDLDLPAGAELRDVGAPDDPAGAVVELADGGRLSISSPLATDADRVAVETSLRVADADSLEVGIAHREKDLRYPLQLDPTYAFCHGGCADYWNDWSNWTPVPSNWGFLNGNFNGTWGLAIYPTNETTRPEWYGLGEYAYWQWQGAFFRNENLYRYFSGDLTGTGYNAWATDGVQDPPNARWITGVARVNGDDYDTHSPWMPYATLGGHTNWTLDHCFIGESPTSCNLAALADNHPDLTGRRPTFQATWVSPAWYGVEVGVFLRYAYAYTVPKPGLPSEPRIVTCSTAESVTVNTGDIVRDGTLGVEVPPPGEGMGGHVLGAVAELSNSLHVANLGNGQVSVNRCGPTTIESQDPTPPPNPEPPPSPDDPPPAAADPAATPQENPDRKSQSACRDKSYSYILDHAGRWMHWESTMSWNFNRATTPGDVTPDQAQSAIIAGTDAVVNGLTSCDIADTISATHLFQGDTAQTADIGPNPDDPSMTLCYSRNLLSTVDFGPTGTGASAVECRRGQNTDTNGDGFIRIIASDVRFSTAIDWTTKPNSSSCNFELDLKGIAAHERGHSYGLDHVNGKRHGNLTMSDDRPRYCNEYLYTLGRGDILGLKGLYP